MFKYRIADVTCIFYFDSSIKPNYVHHMCILGAVSNHTQGFSFTLKSNNGFQDKFSLCRVILLDGDIFGDNFCQGYLSLGYLLELYLLFSWLCAI